VQAARPVQARETLPQACLSLLVYPAPFTCVRQVIPGLVLLRGQGKSRIDVFSWIISRKKANACLWQL